MNYSTKTLSGLAIDMLKESLATGGDGRTEQDVADRITDRMKVLDLTDPEFESDEVDFIEIASIMDEWIKSNIVDNKGLNAFLRLGADRVIKPEN